MYKVQYQERRFPRLPGESHYIPDWEDIAGLW